MKVSAASAWRLGLILFLFAAPLLAFAGFGAYFLWERGWSFYGWGFFFFCTLAGYITVTNLTRKGNKTLLPNPTYDDPLPYWTERDRTAWTVVEEHAQTMAPPALDTLNDPNHMKQLAGEVQLLAMKVCRVYRPDATDAFEHLTMPEIITAAELVSHDLQKLVDQYVPGSDVLNIKHFKQARQAMEIYKQGHNVYWLVAAIANPFKAAVQLAANRFGLQSALAQIQNNVLHWFFLMFVHEVGRYLIELNSGRLRVGAKRYLELMAQQKVPPILTPQDIARVAASGEAPPDHTEAHPGLIRIAIVGPVSAGKSSLINTIFGDAKAGVSATPHTNRATRYLLQQAGLPPLELIDTVGFGTDTASEEDVRTAVEAATGADLLLLVVPARSAARAVEVNFLDRLRATLTTRPELRLPPVLLVLNQIDLLSPAMEWQPPYNAITGTRKKEVSIREAMQAAQEAFGKRVEEVIPVSTKEGASYGITDALLPEIVERLGDARGVGLLRALHLSEAVLQRGKKIAGQVYNVGKELFKTVLKGEPKKN